METHPEEFYTTATDKWKFIYSDYFKDAMSETEKGMIYDKIKEIRKAEFTARVMQTITADITSDELQLKFSSAPLLGGGTGVTYR